MSFRETAQSSSTLTNGVDLAPHRTFFNHSKYLQTRFHPAVGWKAGGPIGSHNPGCANRRAPPPAGCGRRGDQHETSTTGAWGVRSPIPKRWLMDLTPSDANDAPISGNTQAAHDGENAPVDCAMDSVNLTSKQDTLDARSLARRSSTMSGRRAKRPASPLREVRRSGVSINQLVRNLAANPALFDQLCKKLISRARRKWPTISADLEAFLQQALLQALTCTDIAINPDAGAFLWRCFTFRILEHIRMRAANARRLKKGFFDLAAALGWPYAGLDVPRAAPDARMVNLVTTLHAADRAIARMSHDEAFAYRLFINDDPAVETGLHRHALRRAIAKVRHEVNE